MWTATDGCDSYLSYNHLMEQPTQFYATCFALHQLGADDQLTVGLAWGYVSLRVV